MQSRRADSKISHPLPLVLGHNLGGTVAQNGPSVTRFSPGEVVFERVRDERSGLSPTASRPTKARIAPGVDPSQGQALRSALKGFEP